MSGLRGIVKVKGATKPVIHPYAKNLGSGEIVCTLCSVKVKNGKLWPAHILKKSHKQKAQQARQAARPPPREVELKRPATSMPPPGSVPPAKKARAAETQAPARGLLGGYGDSDGDSDGDGDDGDAAGSTPGGAAAAKSVLPAGFFDEEPQDSEPESGPAPGTSPGAKGTGGTGESKAAAVAGLPAGFFDDDVPGDADADANAVDATVAASADKKATPGVSDENEGGQVKAARAAKAAQAKAAVVPEGFFDDPVMDAKVRKVELVDKAEVEWDKFEKEIAAEDKVSVELVEEDFVQVMDTRMHHQVSEQQHLWKKVDVLKERFKNRPTGVKVDADVGAGGGEGEGDSDSDSDSDEDFEDVGWRKKGL